MASRGIGYINYFQPNMIPDVMLWLDGKDVLGDGSSVGDNSIDTWVDKSAQKNDAVQGTGNDQPFYNSLVQGVGFGSTQDMSGTFTQSLSGNLDWSFAAVLWAENITGDVRVAAGIGEIPGGAPFEKALVFGANGLSDNKTVIALWTGSESGAAGTQATEMYSAMGTYRASDRQTVAYWNSTAGTPGTGGNALNLTSNTFHLGNVPGAAYRWDGYIFELLMFNHVLTAQERAVLRTYFNQKWKIF